MMVRPSASKMTFLLLRPSVYMGSSQGIYKPSILFEALKRKATRAETINDEALALGKLRLQEAKST